MTFSRFTLLVLTAALAAVTTACGGSSPASGGGSAAHRAGAAASAAGHLDVVFGDCSSFRRYTKVFVPEMVRVATDSARRRRAVWAACFDGAPLRTLRWAPKVDFGETPPNLSGPQVERLNLARALGLRPRLAAMADTPEKVGGSGQLEALEVAAQTAGVGRVWMFTDAVINEVDGISLRTATLTEIRDTIRRWTPRLRGLAGVQLALVGVGLGTHDSQEVRNALALFRGLAAAVGTRSFSWSLELPPLTAAA